MYMYVVKFYQQPNNLPLALILCLADNTANRRIPLMDHIHASNWIAPYHNLCRFHPKPRQDKTYVGQRDAAW